MCSVVRAVQGIGYTDFAADMKALDKNEAEIHYIADVGSNQLINPFGSLIYSYLLMESFSINILFSQKG